jgi:hypothetical protein
VRSETRFLDPRTDGALNFIQFETAQKLRGGFYTDADIVRRF